MRRSTLSVNAFLSLLSPVIFKVGGLSTSNGPYHPSHPGLPALL